MTVKRLGDVCRVFPGFAFKSSDLRESGIPVVKIGSILEDGIVDVEHGQFLPEEKMEERHKKFMLQGGDIVLAMTGEGKVGRMPENRSAFLNQRVCRLDPVDEGDREYLWTVVKQMDYSRLFNQLAKGAAQANISGSQIEAIRIDWPSEYVRRKVGEIRCNYDDLIENNRRRIKLLEESARLLYREWFVHLRFPGHEHVKVVDGVPEGWDRKPLSALAEINARSLHGKYDGEIEYIDIASVTTGSINGSTTYRFSDAPGRARRVVRHGDVIWSCVRPNRASYAMVWQPIENLIASTGFCVISPTLLSPTYAYFALSTKDFIGYLTSNAKGAAYPAVVASNFEKYEILVPPAPVLGDFRTATETSFDMIETLKRQNEKLRQARNLLLPRLMSGELAV